MVLFGPYPVSRLGRSYFELQHQPWLPCFQLSYFTLFGSMKLVLLLLIEMFQCFWLISGTSLKHYTAHPGGLFCFLDILLPSSIFFTCQSCQSWVFTITLSIWRSKCILNPDQWGFYSACWDYVGGICLRIQKLAVTCRKILIDCLGPHSHFVSLVLDIGHSAGIVFLKRQWVQMPIWGDYR